MPPLNPQPLVAPKSNVGGSTLNHSTSQWFALRQQRRRRNTSSSGGGANISMPEDFVMRLKADSLNLTAGDPVPSWPDLSGNGNDATQSTVSMQPTLDSATWGGNSFPVVRFDTVDDGMQTPLVLTADDPFSIFAFWRPNDLTAFATSIVSSGSLNWVMGTFGPGSGMLCYFTDWTSGAAVNTDAFYLFEVRINPGEQPYAIYLNGIQCGCEPNGGSSAPEQVMLGASGHNTYPAACECAEILIYNRFLSDPEAQSVRSYFQAQYNYLNQ